MVHPKARIIAEAGPIVIGEGNLIEEQVLIINRYSWHSHISILDNIRLFVYIFFSLCAVFSSFSYPENIKPDMEEVEPKTMIIGNNNVFEVGCGILLE